jgi:hypothetical protein
MRTASELIAGARRVGVEVTQRMIDEWQRAGFLPAPTRQKVPGQGRGRAPYQYPDHTLDVAIWLGTHRRFISGVDTTRFWLWLEGNDHVHIDPIMFLLLEILLAWDDLRTSIPSLPDITQVVEHGLSDDQVDHILDEWDAAITVPALASGELYERTAPQVYLDALMYGAVPSAWVDPATGDMPAEASAMYDLPPDDPRIAGVARSLPYMVRASSLVTLYRKLFAGAEWARVHEYLVSRYHELPPEAANQLCDKCNSLLSVSIQPWWLRNWWRFLTPELIGTYWRGGPGPSGGVPRLRSRAELLRYWQYDPLQFLMFAANIQDRLERGIARAAPHTPQPPQRAHAEGGDTG